MMAYVVVIDTLCEGWQAWGESSGEVEIYETEEKAQAEIDDVFAELRRNQIESGMEADEEPSEFVVPLHEYIGVKKIISLRGDG